MAKSRTQFLCNQCGSVHPKWMGKCPDCGAWDSLEEYKAPTPDARKERHVGGATRVATADVAHGADPLTLAQIDETDTPRTPTGTGEFDRILGGGIVAGSAVLVGGEPGIGKSTLLLQVASDLASGKGTSDALLSKQDRALRRAGLLAAPNSSSGTRELSTIDPAGAKVLYVTSEESARQTKLRAA